MTALDPWTEQFTKRIADFMADEPKGNAPAQIDPALLLTA